MGRTPAATYQTLALGSRRIAQSVAATLPPTACHAAATTGHVLVVGEAIGPGPDLGDGNGDVAITRQLFRPRLKHSLDVADVLLKELSRC